MPSGSMNPGEARRMLREGLAEKHIEAAKSLIDHCRESEEEIRSLHLRYGMTGLGRLEKLKKTLEMVESAIDTARQDGMPIVDDLVKIAHMIRDEIVFWSEEIHRAFEEA